MINLSTEQLKKVQSIELEMLLEIDRICRKHNINYSLDGGTLLGAIRHDGFIPWDDDADVVMLRSEYERFFEICKGELDESRFFLQEYRTDSEYRWGYSKLRRKNTLFLRDGQEHINCNQGVFVDIFICDNVPDQYLKRKLHWCKCFLIRKGLYSVVGQRKGRSLNKLIYKVLAKVPRIWWERKLYQTAEKINCLKTELVGHMTYPYPRTCKYGIPRVCFEEYVEKDFSGHKFYIFKDYETYLRLLYGEYMVLPPEDKRKVHPVSKIELGVGE